MASESDKFLDVVIKAAFEAGRFLLDNLDGVQEVNYKGPGYSNPFSRVDTGAENIIADIVGGAFPEHRFISEERGREELSLDYTWIVDPLDGTVNYLHGYRHFSVSIALAYKRDVIVGVIYNPVLDEMFIASKGEGAYRNGKRIRVSEIENLGKSLLAMGFPYDRNSEAFKRSVSSFASLARDGQAIRREGSTALALCSVACGRHDGFCVSGNEVWDYAAGILIVAEAGGTVTDFQGNPFDIINSTEVLATNGKLHRKILGCLRTA